MMALMRGVIHGTEFLRVLLCCIGACLYNVSVKKDLTLNDNRDLGS